MDGSIMLFTSHGELFKPLLSCMESENNQCKCTPSIQMTTKSSLVCWVAHLFCRGHNNEDCGLFWLWLSPELLYLKCMDIKHSKNDAGSASRISLKFWF